MKRHSSGFTIVELMVAMVILMIIMAIAIPHYLSALQRGHEAVAVSFLRQIDTGQEAYRLANDKYADTFQKLQPYVSAGLMKPSSPDAFAGGGFVSVAYAAPLPPSQGKSGSAPGTSGSTPPGQGGTPPGQSGTPPGQGGGSSGSGGSSSGGSSTGGSSGSTSGGSTTPGGDTKVYSMYIFTLTSPDNNHWNCTAEPVRDRLSNRFFFADETNTIHVTIGTMADAASPQI
jgi:prepilin-type N-terminal cleavage/methylation domain-containing protein